MSAKARALRSQATTAVAWLFAWGAYAACIWVTVAYARCFTKEETDDVLIDWIVSLGNDQHRNSPHATRPCHHPHTFSAHPTILRPPNPAPTHHPHRSAGISFLLTEPVQIVLIACLPCIFKADWVQSCMDRMKDAGMDCTLLA